VDSMTWLRIACTLLLMALIPLTPLGAWMIGVVIYVIIFVDAYEIIAIAWLGDLIWASGSGEIASWYLIPTTMLVLISIFVRRRLSIGLE